MNFFHRLFNPHCPHCAEELVCTSCEDWKRLYESEKAEKQRLLNIILSTMEDDVEELKPAVAPEPVISKIVPWRVQREMLEREDAHKAKILKEQKEMMDTLEKELEIHVDPKNLEAASGN